MQVKVDSVSTGQLGVSETTAGASNTVSITGTRYSTSSEALLTDATFDAGGNFTFNVDSNRGAGAGTVPDAHDPSKKHAPIMFTTDLSLKADPAYAKISKHFHENPQAFADAFGAVGAGAPAAAAAFTPPDRRCVAALPF